MDYQAAVKQIAEFLNQKVDIPYVLEQFEQSAFEFAVGLVVKAIPEEVSWLPGINPKNVIVTAALKFIDNPEQVGKQVVGAAESINRGE